MEDNNNKQPQRRNSGWRMIWPYIVIAIFIFFTIYLMVNNLSSSTSTWTVGNLDTYTSYNVETGAYDNTSGSASERYYIKSYTVNNYYSATVTVTGEAYSVQNVANASSNNNRASVTNFTFNIDYALWSEPFEVTFTDSTGTLQSVEHPSYSTIFTYKVEQEWKNNSALVSSYGSGSITTNNLYVASWWDTWGPTVIQIVLLVGVGVLFYYFLARSMGGSSGRSAMDFNKSPARREDASKVRFSDVAGCDEEKNEMVELVEYLKEPKKYSKYGARLPKGVLLIGNPGTGKTLLAKAVAGEAKVPFYSISGSDFVEMFVGVGAGRVRDLFKKAKQTAPCIIFIDEIDAVGRQRGAGLGGGNDEREQTLNQLLVEMDGFEYNSGILVMAATNRDDVLDPALLRPGRFDRIITVSLPDKAGREAIFKVHARNKQIEPSVDFAALAQRTVGFSGADIENILNEAAILAVRFHKEKIGMAEIDEAIDRRIAGPAKNSRAMNEMERKQVAYHESGHAIIGLVLPHSQKVQKITIIPRGNTGGHVLMTPEYDRFLLTKKELLAEITGLLGGRASEEIFFDDVSTGASNDIQEATRIARGMVTQYGMSDLGPIQYERNTGSVFLGRDYADTQKNFSAEVAEQIDRAVREIVESCHEEAKRLIKEHENEVKLIAETLLKQETITAEEIESLVNTGKLPEKNQASVNFTAEEKAVFSGKYSEVDAMNNRKGNEPEPPAPEEPATPPTDEEK